MSYGFVFIRSNWSLAMLCVVFGMGACRRSPQAGGGSLRCGSDNDCSHLGSEWRCHRGICVANSLPEIVPPSSGNLLLGDTWQSGSIDVSDSDGDEVELVWRQLEGPGASLIDGELVAAQLSVTPVAVGLHRFSVAARDALGEGRAESFSLFVQPALDALYVSPDGSDSHPEGCGQPSAPCATLQGALGMASQGGDPTIVLGASLEAYDVCLNLSGDQRVLGCHDTQWRAVPPEFCRLRCADPAGHILTENARLAGVVLELMEGTGAPLAADGVRSMPRTTVRVLGGSPSIENTDVMMSGCDAMCSTAGIASLDAALDLTDVNIRGILDNNAFAEISAAVVTFGGMLHFTTNNGPSGGVLDVATAGTSHGIFAVQTQVDLDGLDLTGGLVTGDLVGLTLLDSGGRVANLRVTPSGFALRRVRGVVAGGCDTSEECDCESWFDLCPTDFATVSSDLSVSTSTISTSRSSSLSGDLCTAIGIDVAGADRVFDVRQNVVELHSPASLNVGLLFAASSTASGGAHIVGNTFTLGGGFLNAACESLGLEPSSTVKTLEAGTFGAALLGGKDMVVFDNRIQTDAHDTTSTGLFVRESSGAWIEQNVISAGLPGDMTGGLLGAAVGAELQSLGSQNSAVFTRNLVSIADTVRVGGVHGASSGTALVLRDVALEEQANAGLYWDLSHNFFLGGSVPHSLGAEVFTRNSAIDWPRAIHNTWVAGGDPTVTLSTLGWAFTELGAPGPDWGRFEHNLIDMGDALGRRMAIDNTLFSEPATLGNVVQRFGSVAGPLPGVIVGQRNSWSVHLQDAGLLVTADALGELRVKSIFTEAQARVPRIPISSRVVRQAPNTILVMNFGDEVGVAPFSDFTQGTFGLTRIRPMALGESLSIVDAVVTNFRGSGTELLLIEQRAENLFCDTTATEVFLWSAPLTSQMGSAAARFMNVLCDFKAMAVTQSPTLVAAISAGSLHLISPQSFVSLGSAAAFSAASISEMRFVDLGITSQGGVGDLLIVADGQLSLWTGVSQFGSLPPPVSPTTPICAGSTVVSVDEARWGSNDGTSRKIVVGCEDGVIELYTLSGPNTLDQIDRLLPTVTYRPENIRAIPSQDGSVLGRLLVSDPQRHALVAYTYEEPGGVPTLIEGATTSVLGEVAAVQVTTPVADLPTVFSAAEARDGNCPLVLHGMGADPRDPHLTGGGDCEDGAPGGPANDIDGCGSRTDPAADIGADELDRGGDTCPVP